VIAELFNNQEDEDSFTDEYFPTLVKDYDPKQDLVLTIKLIRLTKVEDWYKDGTTMVKTIRAGGKGRSPYADSTVKLRLKVEVNDKTIYSNYPQEADHNPDWDNLRKMSDEARKEFTANPEILTHRIDEYTLPSILNKLIKSCKKNVKVEMTTTKIDKIHKNFPSAMFD